MTRAPLCVLALLLAVGPATAASPANGRIAYVKASTSPPEIRAVDPDGSGDRSLVVGSQPSWSPDGSRLVYAEPDRGGTVLAIANADGSEPRVQLPRGLRGATPDWSPDGKRIAFESGGDLYSVDVEGSPPRQLTSGSANAAQPAWSADGETLAFTRAGGLWLVDADGGNERALDLAGSSPRYSPDGRWLAFANESAIYIVAADGTGAVRRVTPDGIGAGQPVWSPDGTRLAFETSTGICTIRPDGGALRRVTYTAVGYGLDWQPREVAVAGDSPYSCAGERWDLSVAVTATPMRVAVGDLVRFSVVLRNRGPDPALHSSFGVSWPEELEHASSSSPNGSCAERTGARPRITRARCDAGMVLPGRAVTAATITLRAAGPGPHRVAVALEIISPRDVQGGNERDSATVLVGGCTMTGTTGADVLTGTSHRDVICGLDGHDVIRGLGGNDEIWAGPRDDVVEGGAGNDRIHGGSGRDDLDGGGGDDVVWGNADDDTILGGTGDDALHGGRPRGLMDPAYPEDVDTVDGGGGADVVSGNEGRDVLRGGQGDDVVLARDERSDAIDCGRGRDRLVADRGEPQRHCERVSRR